MILEPSVFLGFAPYLGHRSLQICAASCRQSFDHAYVSDVWQAVDFSQWRPLEGHIEPGDMDLIFALKRVPPGRLRRLVLRSRRISNDGFSAILLMQNQVEELVIDTNLTHLGSASCSCLSGDALALAPSLRRLELLGLPLSALAMSDGMDGRVSLETLVLQLPTLQDLQAIPGLKTLKMLEVFPPAISFNSLGMLLPEVQLFNEALLRIFNSCQQLQQVRLWGFYILDTMMLRALCNLPKLEELHGYYREDVDRTTLSALSRKCVNVHLALPP